MAKYLLFLNLTQPFLDNDVENRSKGFQSHLHTQIRSVNFGCLLKFIPFWRINIFKMLQFDR